MSDSMAKNALLLSESLQNALNLVANLSKTEALEAVAKQLRELTLSEIQLHCGEMTAQEKRTVRAVLDWQAGVIEGRGNDG